MGLSGRKVKQRIGNDPRNLSWADDAARFGSNYLAKFGWDASKGLGAEGEGRTSHLKVAQKLDMLGIGAAHQKDPNGIAWKQNRDFENLLKRLNEASAVQVDAEQTVQVATVDVSEEAMDVDEQKEDTGKEKKKKEKRSKKAKDEKEKKKEKKEKDGKRKRAEDEESSGSHKKAKTSSSPEDSTPAPDLTEVSSEVAPKKAYVPRHRAHRARAIAAKSIASKSSVHISEILGIASSSSQTTSQSVTPPDQGKLTVISEEVELEKITTSTKSVADYFKERLLAKANKSGSSTLVTPTLDSSKEDEAEEPKPRGGLGFSRGKEEDEDEEKPKGGLGFSRVSWEEHQFESNALRMGLSKFSSLMSSTVLSSTASFTPSTKTEVPLEKKGESSKGEESGREERKRRRKEEKRLRKEEKGRKKEAKKRKAEKEAGSYSPGEEVSKKEKSKEKKSDKKKKTRKSEDS